MNTHRDAWKAGIMVLVGAGTGVAFFLYLAGPTYFAARVEAETYIPGGVTGLAVGANVALRGVNVGRVTDLTFPGIQYGGPKELFNKEYGDYVTIVFEITAESPDQTVEDLQALFHEAIEQGLRARTKMAGITGGAFLELGDPGPNAPPPFAPSWKPLRLYIPSAPGVLDEMITDIQSVLRKMSSFDLDGISNKLNKLLADADNLVEQDGKQLLESLRQNSAALQVILKDPEIQRALKEVADAADGIHHVIKSNSPAVRELMQSLNETMDNLEALSSRLRQDPSAIIFDAPAPKLPPSQSQPSGSLQGTSN